MHVRSVAKYYGIPVVLHSDQCGNEILPWFDGMLRADEEFYNKFGEPLFSSHMLDLSEESDEEDVAICVEYLKRMAPMKVWLEMKIGGVHGVYEPGSVVLSPERLLSKHQEHTNEKIGSSTDKPIYLVMHEGSGSTDDGIKLAVANGVIKMNIDNGTQWAYWDGLRAFEEENREFLHGKIGDPNGSEKPTKKLYDPCVWTRKAEESMCKRVMEECDKLGSTGRFFPTAGEAACAQLGEPKTQPSPLLLLATGAFLGSIATALVKKSK